MSTTNAAPDTTTPPVAPPASVALAPATPPPPAAAPAAPEPKNAQALRSLEADKQAAGLPGADGAINGFSSGYAFETAQRMASALASSSIVPKAYQGNTANCMIALEAANRLHMSILAVMQNLDIVHGNPSWRSKFLIATVNASGRFSRMRWRFVGVEGKDDWGCRAYATDLSDGVELLGPLVSIAIAKAEGWYHRTGSKWKTIPELMLMYRSAGWWSRLYDPEDAMGLNTVEEAEDVHGVEFDGRVGAGGMKPVPGADTANQGRRMSLRPSAPPAPATTSGGEIVDAEVTSETAPAKPAAPMGEQLPLGGGTTTVASAAEGASVAAKISAAHGAAEREPGADDDEDQGDAPTEAELAALEKKSPGYRDGNT